MTRFGIYFMALVSCLFIAKCNSNIAAESEFNIDEIKKKIIDYKVENSKAMQLSDYEQLISSWPVPIPKRYSPELWKELQNSQSPGISLRQLSALIKAKRDSLLSLKQRYSFLLLEYSGRNEIPSEEATVEHIFSQRRVYQSIKLKDAKKRDLKLWQDTSYDGNVLRTVDFPFDYPSKGAIVNATIALLENRSNLFWKNNLLRLCMFYNSNEYEDAPSPGMDLVCLLNNPATILLETPIMKDEHMCLLISDGIHRVYLCQEMNYAVVCEEVFVTDRKLQQPGFIAPKKRNSSFVSRNFIPYENGIWLPSRVESVFYGDDANMVQKIITDYEEVIVNPKIDSSFFENIIPDDAFVFDGINKITYKYGDRASIGALLKSTVKSKVITTFRWLSVISGLILIAVALFMRYREYLKKRSVAT